MFDFLNRLGLPLKYAILCGAGALLGVFLARIAGIPGAELDYLSTAVAGTVGGAIGGYIRKRRGKTS